MTSTVSSDSILKLDHEEVLKTVNTLPPLPPAVTRLNKLFADANYEIKDVVRTVELDPVLCGKLLKLSLIHI